MGSEAGAGIRQCLLLSPTAPLPKRRSPSLKEHLGSPCPPCLARRRQPRRHQRCPPRPRFPSCQSLVSTRGAPPVFPCHRSSLEISSCQSISIHSIPRVLCLPSCQFVPLSFLLSFFSILFLAFWAGGVRGAGPGLGDLGCVRSELGASVMECKTQVGSFR